MTGRGGDLFAPPGATTLRPPMKVLLVGNGGREHALAWKLASSPRVTALYAAPGNPGTAQVADNVPIGMMEFDKLLKFVRENGIGFVVIGPEDPLAAGLTDRLQAAGVKVFGPSKAAAQIEGDKWFAKEIMRQQAVPTAEARSFTDAGAAEEFVRMRGAPIVGKAAGLAKGKGVSVCYRVEEAGGARPTLLPGKGVGGGGARGGIR